MHSSAASCANAIAFATVISPAIKLHNRRSWERGERAELAWREHVHHASASPVHRVLRNLGVDVISVLPEQRLQIATGHQQPLDEGAQHKSGGIIAQHRACEGVNQGLQGFVSQNCSRALGRGLIWDEFLEQRRMRARHSDRQLLHSG